MFGLVGLDRRDLADLGETPESAASGQPPAYPHRHEVGVAGDPVVLLAERDPEVPGLGAREHPQPYQAVAAGLCPVHPHDRPGDGDGGLGAPLSIVKQYIEQQNRPL